ncbi:MAG TPA: CGNR zinc finger domain-containing protein [Streptosporangiaceae bacterium]
MNFNGHTDAVLAVTVALINTLTPGDAHGRLYTPPEGAWRPEAARQALSADGVIRSRPVSVAEADELARVADELRRVIEAVAAGDADRAAAMVNELLVRTGAHPYLERHDGEPWHLHYHSTEERLATGWAAGCTAGLAVVLGGPEWRRLGVCTAPRCDRVYVDTSRNGTRRFCSTTCQNRVKAAGFRERKGQSAGYGQRAEKPLSAT